MKKTTALLFTCLALISANLFAEALRVGDPDKKTAEAYQVLHMLGYARRYTFYIGVDGTILKIDTEVQHKALP